MKESLKTTKQLAEAIQAHPQTVYKWVRNGEIPYVKIGRSVRFNLDAVMASLSHSRTMSRQEVLS